MSNLNESHFNDRARVWSSRGVVDEPRGPEFDLRLLLSADETLSRDPVSIILIVFAGGIHSKIEYNETM